MTFIFSNRISQSALTLTAFICFTLIAFADRVHAARAVTGADIADAIVQTLELEGEEAGPKILATKKYFPCDAPLEILPMFGSWKTVRVNCASPIPWKLIVRAQWPPEPQIEGDAEEPKQEPDEESGLSRCLHFKELHRNYAKWSEMPPGWKRRMFDDTEKISLSMQATKILIHRGSRDSCNRIRKRIAIK